MYSSQVTYSPSVQQALNWITSKIDNYGLITGLPLDIACYYKLPMLLLQQGRWDLADRILNTIQIYFVQPNGDLMTSASLKSANPTFIEFWTYTNGWIAMAAQRAGRFDLSYPLWKYLRSYQDQESGGWKTRQQPDRNSPLDILTTAHLGLAALYMGDLQAAISSGEFLREMLRRQKPEGTKFYLRIGAEGKLITDYPPEMAIFEHVDSEQPNQAYFMLGYPIAFLTKLYQTTQRRDYLEAAQAYYERVECCTGNLRSFFFSHKVAWGASGLAAETGNTRSMALACDIANYLVSIQEKNGSWLTSQDLLTHLDQTIEIAIWLSEIDRNIALMGR